MEQGGSHVSPQVDKLKTTRGRRSWSRVEEDALIHCLMDIVNDGWKAENGFRAGFQRKLERGMKRILPMTDIVANPNINSKIHVWKKEYGTLSDLLSKSGIGWNSTTSMIDIEDESIWEGCRRADPSLKGVRYKTWPYYSQWIEIFGNDRATGENAVDPTDLGNRGEFEGETCEKYVPLNQNDLQDLEDNSICKPHLSVEKVTSKGKKRKSVDADLSMLVDSLGEFMKQSNEQMGDLSKGKGKGNGPSYESRQLNEIMKGIVGLKMSDKIKVCDELVKNPMRLDFFLSLTSDEHEEYVWMLLGGRLQVKFIFNRMKTISIQ
ncbi:hypothetical protein ACS0TY_005565 [Phlomoides rotata]